MPKVLHLFNPTVEFDPALNSTLVNNINTEFTSDHYHTSLGDLQGEEIISISKYFDTVNFVSTGFDVDSSIYRETLLILQFLKDKCRVTNFQFLTTSAPMTSPNQNLTRNNVEPLLWVFGCSHSAGVGLLPDQKSFGNLLGEYTELPPRIIAQSGSSTHWSLRHMLNADIQEQDTVVWQLTTPQRVSFYKKPQIQEIQLRNSPELTKLYTPDHLFFKQISLLNNGVMYLRAKKCKFVITSILAGTNKEIFQYMQEYLCYPEYCYTPKLVLDYGTDGLHVGPLSHQSLAQDLVDHLKLCYE
jgi:hypothetical protein